MEPTGPAPPRAPARTSGVASSAPRWQLGQVLKATALADTRNGQTPLQIGRQLVQAESPVPLQRGQQLSLQVSSLTDLPVLRILSGLGANPLAEAIRSALPRQDSLAPLLANLVQAANNRQLNLPPLIARGAQQLVQQLPDPRQLSQPEGLKRALAQSGIFLEGQLARDGALRGVELSRDFKANLLRLIRLVRSWPGAQPRGPLPPATASSPGAGPSGPAAPNAAPPSAPVAGTSPPAPPSPLQAGPGPAPSAAAEGEPPASPATLARGLKAAATTPSAAASSPRGAPSAPSTVPTAGGPATPSTPDAQRPAPPPLRGQAPLPQTAPAANLQRLELAGLLRPELQRQVESALARLQLNQLASVPRDRDSGMEWLLEVPVRRGEETDLWSLRIRRDEGGRGRGEAPAPPLWSVQLAFDLPGLGPMQARVALQGEQVSTWFWAQREQAVPLLEDHLQELRQGLEGAGLQVGELVCHLGQMPTPRPSAADPDLVNEQV